MIAVLPKSFWNNEILMEELKAAFPNERVSNWACDADAAIIGLNKVDDLFLSRHPKIKVISKYGVGMDNIDLEACKRRWVRVASTPGVNAPYVAEHTLGLMLSLLRNIHKGINEWAKEGGTSLQDRTVGIIGLGAVGSHVERLVQKFGAQCFHNDIDSGLTKEYLFENCDVITLHVPLTPLTKHLVNAQTLALMKPWSVLINTSRGGVVDQKALKEALKNKKIAGAALDVFEDEPCLDDELLNMENVVCTPHIAGNSKQAVLAMGRAAIENLKKLVGP